MHRLDENYIVLTNNEARELQKALAQGSEAAEQLAQDRYDSAKHSTCDEEEEGETKHGDAAQKVANSLKSWQNRIHKIWTFSGD